MEGGPAISIRRHAKFGVLVPLVALLLAGCGPEPTPTATPEPLSPSAGVHTAEQALGQYEGWPDGYKFQYSDDIQVKFTFPWSMATWPGRVSIAYVPTASAAWLDPWTTPKNQVDATSATGRLWRVSDGSDEGLAALLAALADEALQAKIDAWLVADRPWAGPDDVAQTPILFMWAEPADSALTKLLKAEIVGGPDNNRDLYCTGGFWRFGDGYGTGATPSCIPWRSSFVTNRHFAQRAVYSTRGTYEASVEIGPLSASTTVVVQ